MNDSFTGLDHPESTSTVVDAVTMATTVLELAGWVYSQVSVINMAHSPARRSDAPRECWALVRW